MIGVRYGKLISELEMNYFQLATEGCAVFVQLSDYFPSWFPEHARRDKASLSCTRINPKLGRLCVLLIDTGQIYKISTPSMKITIPSPPPNIISDCDISDLGQLLETSTYRTNQVCHPDLSLAHLLTAVHR